VVGCGTCPHGGDERGVVCSSNSSSTSSSAEAFIRRVPSTAFRGVRTHKTVVRHEGRQAVAATGADLTTIIFVER
jgi:hypothetical protein